MSPSSNDLAKERTDWAEDRTMLANERTFAGWMRTGMASAALGLGFNALLRYNSQDLLAKAGATVFALLAIGIFVIAYRNARDIKKRLDSHSAEPISSRQMGLVCTGLTIGVVIMTIVLWTL